MIKSGSFPALKGESKIVTQADMWSKLARNAKPKVEVMQSAVPKHASVERAGVSASAENTPIEWGEPEKYGPGAWGIKSTDGRFWIHKVQSRESVTYTAWRRGMGLMGLNEKLGEAGTADEAKALCVP